MSEKNQDLILEFRLKTTKASLASAFCDPLPDKIKEKLVVKVEGLEHPYFGEDQIKVLIRNYKEVEIEYKPR